MNITRNQFVENLARLRERMESACAKAGRDPSSVKLMAVTKTHPLEAVAWAQEAGLPCVGENRVQEAATKKEGEGTIPWELIGHLQSNKARLALQTFNRIQSVDRPKLVSVLDRLCGEMGLTHYPVLLQINAGKDPAKYGADLESADELLRHCLEAAHLKLEGLMTIAPLSEDPRIARACFHTLAALRDKWEQQHHLSLPELSMGMSGDLEMAIAEGSTLVRVGSALYGSRQ